MIVVALISVYPFVNGIYNSFFSDAVFGGGKYFSGLENFRDLMSDSLSGRTEEQLYMVGCSVGFELAIGMLIALLLNLPYIKLRGLYRALILLPWATTPVVAALIWRYIFGVMGPLNSF